MTDFILSFYFIISSILLSYQDIKNYHISLPFLYISTVCFFGLIYLLKMEYLVNACLAAVLIFLLFIIIRVLTKGHLGWGDIKFSLICGLFSGFPEIITGCFFSSLLGLSFLLIIKLHNKEKDIKTMKIPFIPFMSIGCIIAKHITSFIMNKLY